MIFPVFKNYHHPHPDSGLQVAWNYAQWGLLLFPILPIFGSIGLFLASVGTWRRRFKLITQQPLNRGLAILSIWLIIIAGFAEHHREAFLGLGNFLPFFIFFAAFSTLIQTPSQLRQLTWILLITSVPIIILGLGQQFLEWSGPFLGQGFLGWVLEAKGRPAGRMASVFMYANTLASYLVIVFTLGLGLWIATLKSATQSLTSWRIHPPFLFLTLVLLGNLAALILTNSRNAWGLAAMVCLVYALYLGWRWLVGLVGTVATAILGAAFAPQPVAQWLRQVVPTFFWTRLTDQNFPNRPIATLRTTQWQFAWEMTQQRPLTGWGLRNFTPLYQEQMHLWLGHPHNLILMLTAEIGIPGTLLFCGMVAWILGQSILLLKSPLNPEKADTDELYKTSEKLLPLPQNLVYHDSHSIFKLPQDRFIFLSYLMAFFACTCFNMVDVTVFDLRVNALGWLLLAALYGVISNSSREF